MIPFPGNRPARVGGDHARSSGATTSQALPARRSDARPTGDRVAGSQRHGDPDLHSETDGLKHARRPRHHLSGGGAPSRCRAPVHTGAARAPRRPKSLHEPVGASSVRSASAPVGGLRAHRARSSRGETLIGLLKRAGRHRRRRTRGRARRHGFCREHPLPPRRHAGRRSRRTAPGEPPRELVFQLGDRPAAAPAPLRLRLERQGGAPALDDRHRGRGRDDPLQPLPGDARPPPRSIFSGRAQGRADVGARRHLRVPRRHEPRPAARATASACSSSARSAPSGATRVGKVLAAIVHALAATRSPPSASTASRRARATTTRKGKSLRAQFLRAPLEFRRISSMFGMPLPPDPRPLEGAQGHRLRRVVGHAGARDRRCAVVVRAGWAGGYGNVLELRHRNGYVTRYGHLRGFAKGVRAGARVEIGADGRLRGNDGAEHRPAPALRGAGRRRAARLARRASRDQPAAARTRASAAPSSACASRCSPRSTGHSGRRARSPRADQPPSPLPPRR